MFFVAGVAHRVAEDLLGAAKDGSVKVFIVAGVADRVVEGLLGAAKDGGVKVFILSTRTRKFGPERAL